MSEPEPAKKQPGLVYTFYSYKGGVGRSMALANVGVLMATEGYRVLLVDWDLEAPGLEVFFRKAAKLSKDPGTIPGIVDLLEAHAQSTSLSWRDCLLKAKFFGKSLDILSAGRRTDDYRRRVQQLDWDTLFREHRIGNYINGLREEWRSDYDYVLVDSRTGITDIGDICTVILPDILVLLFVTNYQNVEGIKNAMARAVKARSVLPVNRNKLLGVPVPSRDERDRESDKFAEWKRIFASEFSEFYREWLPKEVNPLDALHRIYIPYVAGWSFGERIPVIESERERNDPSSLGAAYARLATLLSHRLDWSALESRASTADVLGARVELSKAREDARDAEIRLEQLKKETTLRSRKRAQILVGVGLILLLLVGRWWDATYAYPARLALRLKDRDPSVRASAASGLGKMGSAALPYVPAIAELLTDKESSVRASAVSAMARMGSLANPYLPGIAALLRDADPDVRENAVEAFRLIWFSSTLVEKTYAPEIAKLLDDTAVPVRRAAVHFFEMTDDKTANYAPAFAKLLKENDHLTQWYAIQALGNIGANAVPFAPDIVVFLKDESSYNRKLAVEALGNMGKTAAQFAPDVARLLNDKDGDVRKASEEALKKMGQEQLIKR